MTTSTTMDMVEQRITGYLESRLPHAESLTLGPMQRNSVGWSHETFLFDARWLERGVPVSRALCVRRDPGQTLLRDHSDLSTQFRVLQALDGTPVRAPKPYWYEADPEVLGGPFIVMEKVQGVCPEPWSSSGRAYYRDAAERGVLPSDFVAALAELHTLDWREAGLSFLDPSSAGQGFALAEITRWRDLIEQSQRPPEPVLVDVIAWLEEHAPEERPGCLVHGAYRTGNLLIQDDRVTAVLDWELQSIGDPMFDVAYVLSDLNRQGSDLLSNLVPRDVFYREYEAASGITIDDEACHYYEVLYAMRTAAFWMSACGLYAQGASEDLRLARTRWSVDAVLDRAARLIGY